MKQPDTTQEVRTYYEVRAPNLRQHGAEWRGPRPVHNGKDPNFAVKADTGSWYCHSQCERGGSMIDLEMVLGGQDFKPAVPQVDRIVGRVRPRRRRTVATYDCIDHSGVLRFQVVRHEPKGFSQRRSDGKGGWIWSTKAFASSSIMGRA
jgi:hypothetical protein